MVELSIVIPVYGCDGCLRALHERLTASMAEITSDYEVVFVDDRSRDGGWDTLGELVRSDPRVRAARLSRNFGQHAAITAGLAESRGRWVVVMDCDLQEPPEVIPRLYAKARQGYEIVLTSRRGRSESRLRELIGRAYLRLRNFLLGQDVRTDHGTLSLLSRKAVDAFLSVGDRDREYVLVLNWLGFKRVTVEFDHDKRYEGRSSYTFRSLIRVSVDGLFFQTTVLLHWIVYLGFAIALGGFLLAVYFLFAYFAIGGTPAGFTSIAVLLLLLGGFIIASIGIVGLYVGKVFEQSKDRPLYVIDERSEHGIDEGVEPLTNAPPASRRFAEADRTSLARTGRRNKPVG